VLDSFEVNIIAAVFSQAIYFSCASVRVLKRLSHLVNNIVSATIVIDVFSIMYCMNNYQWCIHDINCNIIFSDDYSVIYFLIQ